MIQANSLLVLLLLPFAGSIAAALLPSGRNAEAWLSGVVAVVGLVTTVSLYPDVVQGGVARHEVAWLPTFGLSLTIRLDGFAWLMMMLITSIGLLVVLYARYYLSPKDPVARFFACLLAFMGAMLGVVLSGNLVHADRLLGADQPLLLPADRLLAAQPGGARRGAHGADRHRHRRALPVRRRAAARPASSASTTSTGSSPPAT